MAVAAGATVFWRGLQKVSGPLNFFLKLINRPVSYVGMPRPINADAAATKQRILDSALHLFADRGIDGVSLRELAADARVSSAMIHHCFGGKDGLREAAIDSMYSQFGGAVLEMVQLLAPDKCHSPGEVFDRAVRFAFSFCRRHQSSVRLLMRDVVANGELDARREATTNGPFVDQITARLGQIIGTDPSELRMPLHSCVTLVGRYAVSSDAELMRLTCTANVEDALAATEETLRQNVRLLMRLPGN